MTTQITRSNFLYGENIKINNVFQNINLKTSCHNINKSKTKLNNNLMNYIKYTATQGKVSQYAKNTFSKHYRNGKLFDKATLKQFIKLVSIPTKKLFYSQYYNENDKVKPFFDYDEKLIYNENKDLLEDKNKLSDYKKTILERLLHKIQNEFTTEDEDENIIVSVGENSRYIFENGTKKYKISYHLIVNNTEYCLVKELKKIADFFGCDTNVYKGNRILRFSNQFKDDTSLEKPTLIDIKIETNRMMEQKPNLENFIIFPSDKQEYKHISLIPCLQLVKQKRQYKKGNNQFTPIKINSNYSPQDIQIKILKKILFDLPNKYFEEYDEWLRIGIMLNNFSNDQKLLNLWILFSRQSKEHTNDSLTVCSNTWKYMKPRQNPLTIASLIALHKELPKKIEKTNYYHLTPKRKRLVDKKRIEKHFVDYKILHKPIKFNPLEGIENLKKLETQYISTKYITEPNGKPIKDIKKFLERKIIFIKSPTGSGKTTLINYLTKHKKVISVVSRRTLATTHLNAIDAIKYHYNDKKTEDETIGKVYQLDSLYEKGSFNFSLLDIEYESGNYTLILDEFNSMINHFWNYLKNMRERRIELTSNLLTLIENADQVLCFDADITTSTIQWLYENIDTRKEKPILIVNKPNNKIDTEVVFYKDLNIIVEKMKIDIQEKKYFFCCSDRCRRFFKDIIIKLVDKKLLEEFEIILEKWDKKKDDNDFYLETKNVVIYCGYKTPSKLDTSTWKNKFVFTTPTIIYGIDYNLEKTHKIYSINFGGTLNALQINQQIGRIRKPININFYIEEKSIGIFYTWPKYIECFDNIKNLKLWPNEFKYINDSYLNSLNRLHQRYNYINDYLSCHIKFHIINIMKNKGYCNFTDNGTILKTKKVDKVDKVNLPCFLKKIGINCNDESNLLFERFVGGSLAKVIKKLELSIDDITFNSSKMREFLNISRIRENFSLAKINDTGINKLLSPFYKIELLNIIKDKVGIKSVDEFNRDIFRHSNSKTVQDKNLLNRISIAFKIKTKSPYPLGQLFGKLLNHLLPTFTIHDRISTKGKQYKGFYINEIIKPLLLKIKIKSPQRVLRQKLMYSLITEYDDIKSQWSINSITEADTKAILRSEEREHIIKQIKRGMLSLNNKIKDEYGITRRDINECCIY